MPIFAPENAYSHSVLFYLFLYLFLLLDECYFLSKGWGDDDWLLFFRLLPVEDCVDSSPSHFIGIEISKQLVDPPLINHTNTRIIALNPDPPPIPDNRPIMSPVSTSSMHQSPIKLVIQVACLEMYLGKVCFGEAVDCGRGGQAGSCRLEDLKEIELGGWLLGLLGAGGLVLSDQVRQSRDCIHGLVCANAVTERVHDKADREMDIVAEFDPLASKQVIGKPIHGDGKHRRQSRDLDAQECWLLALAVLAEIGVAP